ncbi:helix-turn-helix transcriptional regulator [Flavobacterium sp. FlaQc-52]|jgi:DNA-binding CsgD family transcriptional regulator|uniref:helix-turn-helix domain-containing protein n=1 Tax=Flavobacterium sp. FlaQc-52 TaxID=3374185 RepID=UPI00375789ED
MVILEIILFIVAYTALIVSLAFGIVCYKRNIEPKETITLTISLLLLIVSISISPLLKSLKYDDLSNILIVSNMTIVGCTTFLNTLKERKHKLKKVYKKIHVGIGLLIFSAVIISPLLNISPIAERFAIGYLLFSITVSMVMIRVTKPQIKMVQKINPDRLFAIAFLIIVPLYLILQFGFSNYHLNFPIGFLLPVIFTLLAINKIIEDINRLHILKNRVQNLQNDFFNYGFTDREVEVARLLVQGCSYQSISEQLFISVPTVKTHTGNVYRKCNVKSKYELMVLITA